MILFFHEADRTAANAFNSTSTPHSQTTPLASPQHITNATRYPASSQNNSSTIS